MKCSICIATYNKAPWLEKTLDSIFSQKVPFEFETIVVDDGSSDNTKDICKRFHQVDYIKVERKPIYRNPAIARNIAYRKASGKVLICQSDDVVHVSKNTIEHLTNAIYKGKFVIATVWNTDENGNRQGLNLWPKIIQLTGPKLRRPFFFLGSVFRSDLYKAGGNDELYVGPGSEDAAFGNSLMYGLGLKPIFVSIEGHHITHPRPTNLKQLCLPGIARYKNRVKQCSKGLELWTSPGAPWSLTEK